MPAIGGTVATLSNATLRKTIIKMWEWISHGILMDYVQRRLSMACATTRSSDTMFKVFMMSTMPLRPALICNPKCNPELD